MATALHIRHFSPALTLFRLADTALMLCLPLSERLETQPASGFLSSHIDGKGTSDEKLTSSTDEKSIAGEKLIPSMDGKYPSGERLTPSADGKYPSGERIFSSVISNKSRLFGIVSAGCYPVRKGNS